MTTVQERFDKLFAEGRRRQTLIGGQRIILVLPNGDQMHLVTRPGQDRLMLHVPFTRSMATMAWRVDDTGLRTAEGYPDDGRMTEVTMLGLLSNAHPMPLWGYYGHAERRNDYTSLVLVSPRRADGVVDVSVFVAEGHEPPRVVKKQQGTYLALDPVAWWGLVDRGVLVPLTDRMAKADSGSSLLVRDGKYRHVLAKKPPLGSRGERLLLDYLAWLDGHQPSDLGHGRSQQDLRGDAQSLLRAIR